METKKSSENKPESKLITLLWDDEKLKQDKDKQLSYIGMAKFFLEDFKNNINRTSIDMNELNPFISIDEWKDFLNYPVVHKYIKSFRDEKISNIADAGLMEGDKAAVAIKKAAQEGAIKINNANIVLIRVPEKKELEEI